LYSVAWSSSSLPIRFQIPLPSVADTIESGSTYARELGATVAALGSGTALLDVKQTDITAGGLDNAGAVGTGVPAARSPC
jgi:hypothetical protein